MKEKLTIEVKEKLQQLLENETIRARNGDIVLVDACHKHILDNPDYPIYYDRGNNRYRYYYNNCYYEIGSVVITLDYMLVWQIADMRTVTLEEVLSYREKYYEVIADGCHHKHSRQDEHRASLEAVKKGDKHKHYRNCSVKIDETTMLLYKHSIGEKCGHCIHSRYEDYAGKNVCKTCRNHIDKVFDRALGGTQGARQKDMYVPDFSSLPQPNIRVEKAPK